MTYTLLVPFPAAACWSSCLVSINVFLFVGCKSISTTNELWALDVKTYYYVHALQSMYSEEIIPSKARTVFFFLHSQGNSTRSHLCPPGHFCPPGTGHPLPCPAGSLSTSQGLKGEEECPLCPPGVFCDRPGIAEFSDALTCHAG